MSGTVKLLLLFFILSLQFNNTISQTEKDVTINAWLELGWLKFAPTKKDASTGIDIGLKFQRNRLLANLQYQNLIDRELAKGGFELFTTNNYYHAGNILIGITNKKCRFGHVSLSSGLGVFWGEFKSISSEKFATVGWPVEAAASLNIIPVVGINLKVFTNVNSKHSFIGFGMDLQLGKLRDFKLKRIISIEIEKAPF